MDIKNIQKLTKIYIINNCAAMFYVIYTFSIFYFPQILNLKLVF